MKGIYKLKTLIQAGIRTEKVMQLTANLKRRHDLPTPESPISRSLNK